jgi:signal transduction histidine kinase
MSIRKRLFISNAAMVFMPIVMVMLYFVFLHLLFGNEINTFTNHGRPGWATPPAWPNQAVFTRLEKTASLEPEKLLDMAFLDSLTSELKAKHAGIIVRRGDHIVYASANVKVAANGKLPAFGHEGYLPMAWFGHRPYTIQQHDFFFKDGKKGSLFLLGKGGSFPEFARTFFPLIFIGIVLILVLTNVLLSYLVSRSILKPVRQLSAAADKISRGDLDFHLASNKKDELGKLVNAFDDMRAKLKESLELREKYEKNRRELVANISHDLKTPITSILGYVEGIKDGVANTEEKLRRYLDTIHAKAQYMDRLIDELFLYSKLDVKSLPFHFENVRLSPFLEDYLEELRLELADRQVQIDLHVPDAFDALVLLDRNHIIRAMNNMIYNSVKYTDKENCRIQVSVEEQVDKVKIQICDNGPGVPSEELENIFQRFYRIEPSRNLETGGSGLGLAIAAQIIEAHGGTIWADSRPDEGLCLSFTLQKIGDQGD